MKKVTKAIKFVSALTDEEKQEFAEFFKQEEEEQEESSEKKVEVKKEEAKEEPKVETKEIDFEAKFKELMEVTTGLAEEVKTLKEAQPKLQSFGAKPKQGEGKETKDFNTIFQNLSNRQL